MCSSPKLQFDPNILARSRPGGGLSKDDVRQNYDLETVYRMSLNESPLGPSPKVVEAIQELLAL